MAAILDPRQRRRRDLSNLVVVERRRPTNVFGLVGLTSAAGHLAGNEGNRIHRKLAQNSSGETDGDESAARRKQLVDPTKGRTQIHVMQGGHGHDAVEGLGWPVDGEEVPEHELGAPRISTRPLDARLMAVDAYHLRNAVLDQGPAKSTGTTPDVQHATRQAERLKNERREVGAE